MLGPERRRRTKNILARWVSSGFPGNTLCAALIAYGRGCRGYSRGEEAIVWVVNGEGGTYSHRVVKGNWHK